MAQVKTRQFKTVTEHFFHIGHLAGIQVAQASDGFKFSHCTEP